MNRWLQIKQLDKQLKKWQTASLQYDRPRDGWVKTLREALSMSVEQLGNRLGLSRSRISQLENAEIHDAVTLRTLREAAKAMECELVYAIVPKNHTTLANIIKVRAEQVAIKSVAKVAHSMSLENQAVDMHFLNMQKEDLAKNLMDHLNKKLWANFENEDLFSGAKNNERSKDNKQSDLLKKLIMHNDKKEIDLLKKLIETLQKKK